MADIKASDVKELREKTGVGMMDAKKALVENNGDMEAAVDWLRKAGLAKAAKKSGRVAADGLVAVATSGTKGAVVEVNAETDFVARNEQFQNFAKKVAEIALDANDTADLLAKPYAGGKTVQDTLTELVATIGENMTIRRAGMQSVSKGIVVPYVHSALVPGLGKIGVLLAMESDAPADKLEAIGKQIAMHIAAARPEYLDISSVDPAAIAREKEVLTEKHRASGKPEDRLEGIVMGDLSKNFYGQICLLEQAFVMDGKTKISDVVANAAKEIGADIKVTGFSRFELGEGIEKEEEDFAAEVAKVANG
ncbi:MAG: translation elongation factor Ts [Alphaproteobacteria bacterium]|nr:translation elongation factor Ts [Alphaproteobacteria bacterium]MCD8520406.1 translation elongation factor Ts [Alphaproteobacteria bacterium]MCD8570092.1 translation elongation factor Ts [Alphaproteobacteria bacterium]